MNTDSIIERINALTTSHVPWSLLIDIVRELERMQALNESLQRQLVDMEVMGGYRGQ